MAHVISLKPQDTGVTELAEEGTISQNLCDLNKGRVCSTVLAESTAICFHPVHQQIYFCI